MIFGRTTKEKYDKDQARLKEQFLNKKFFYTKFAFFPTKLDNGQYVWLQKYKYKYLITCQDHSYYSENLKVCDKWVDSDI